MSKIERGPEPQVATVRWVHDGHGNLFAVHGVSRVARVGSVVAWDGDMVAHRLTNWAGAVARIAELEGEVEALRMGGE